MPDDPGTLAELAELRLARGETEEAARMLHRLVRIDPRNRAAWAALARIEREAASPFGPAEHRQD